MEQGRTVAYSATSVPTLSSLNATQKAIVSPPNGAVGWPNARQCAAHVSGTLKEVPTPSPPRDERTAKLQTSLHRVE